MTDEQRKRLTEYLDEKWEEPYIDTEMDYGKARKVFMTVDPNRTFNNWVDLGALKEKIEEKGEWCSFREYGLKYHCPCIYTNEQWEPWLFTPSRFFALAVSWLEGKEGKG